MTRTTSHRPEYIARTLAALALFACATAACDRASPSDPDPPTGGQNYVLSFDEFTTNVNPIFTRLGCDNMTCHGGGIRGTYALTPPGDKDNVADFEQTRLQVYPPDPRESQLLLKILGSECGGIPHAGGSFFFSFDDPDYVTILTWIENGEYQ